MAATCPWSSLERRQQAQDPGQLLLNFLHDNFQPLNTVVYAPRLKHADEKHAPPPIDKGYFSWLKPLIKCHEDDLVDKIGLDATVFLRFLRMLRNLFAVLSIFAVVLIGVNAGCTTKNKYMLSAQDGVDPFIYMSPQFVFGNCLYAHVILSWVFNICVCYFIWRSYRKLVILKKRYFESEEYKASLHSKTLMVTDVPKPAQSNDGLAEIIARVKMSPELTQDQKARVGRDMKELPKLIQEHETTVRKLESVLAKYLKNPDRLPPNRPTMKPFKEDRQTRGEGKVDAIEYLDERLKFLETRIKEVRRSIDNKKPLPYGFVSFSTVQNAHSVAYAARKKHPQGTTIKLAPRPTDLLWENLAKSKRERRWNKTWGWMLYVFLTIVWIVPNAFIATFLANIGRIGALWPTFAGQLYTHKNFWAFVQGVAAPLVTSLVFLVLPIIMRRISARQGDFTKTARERHATGKLFSFFVFNNLVVFTIFGTLWNFVAQVVNETGGVEKKSAWEAIKDFRLATQSIAAVFNVSRFWIMYLLQRNLGALLDLIQFVTLFWRWYSRKFLSPTPREMIEWSAPQPMDFASYYNYFLFYATIAFTFAPVQPLVIPVACLYFTLDSFFRKYAFMYMFVTKTESGGMFWRVLVNRVLIASVFGNIVTAGVVWVNYNGATACAALAPILINIGFKIYCARTFDDKLYYYTKAVDAEAAISETEIKKNRDDKLSDRYGHPALTRKLLTPLVHEKAKHVLARVYQIRNEEGDPYSSSYADDSMDLTSMQKDSVGQPQRQPTGLEHYGFVQEHQLDFHNLQGNARSEFNYIFDSASGGNSRAVSPAPGRPITPGGLSTAGSRPGSPGPGFYAQTNRAKYAALGSPGIPPPLGSPGLSPLGSPGLPPQAGGAGSGAGMQISRSISPLARGSTRSASPGPYAYGYDGANSSSGYFQHQDPGASDSDLTGLLRGQQAVGMSAPGGYDSRPGTGGRDYNGGGYQGYQQYPQSYGQQGGNDGAHSPHQQPQGYPQQYQQQGYQSYTPPPPQQQGGGGNQQGYNYNQGPSNYESYRKG
ncbi:hypothetical protein ABW19_dt0204083 [Dactylella cylindrospora]|nr:hypothetical protein ABW19_dt0204083 [Dactylella cylindrospora]